jgi:hypothetical protein
VGEVCTYREEVSGEVAASVDAAVHVNESSTVIFSFTLGLYRIVLSIITATDST